jgi:LuxR family maltose regulon positive regulatory protein
MQTRSAVGKPASQFSFVIWPIPVGVFAALVQVVLHYFFCLTICPPHVHLIIATRTDPPWPLARMRTRQEMIELRTQDPRFTPDEAAAFLRTTTGLALPAKSICALEARTEGWIAGLQMAALAMQAPTSMQGSDTARSEAFIQAFGGSHRFVLDYLVEEVLDRQNDEIQAFLLHTSILDPRSSDGSAV